MRINAERSTRKLVVATAILLSLGARGPDFEPEKEEP